MKLPCRKGAITLASATRLLEQQATVPRFARQLKPTGGPGRSDLPRYLFDPRRRRNLLVLLVLSPIDTRSSDNEPRISIHDRPVGVARSRGLPESETRSGDVARARAELAGFSRAKWSRRPAGPS